MESIMEFLRALWAHYGGLVGITVLAISAAVTVVAAIANLVISHLSSRKLEQFKVALSRMERLEASRGTGYEAIWSLTGSLNLFGPASPIAGEDSEKLSRKLAKWYFEHGWVLSQESKQRYFLVQEILNFGMLHPITYNRPAGEVLYGSTIRTVDVLKSLQFTSLAITNPRENGEYSMAELQTYVNNWKTRFSMNNRNKPSAEDNWLLLQFVLSAFRTQMIKEIREGP